jgi:hypothetical protein
LPFNLHLTCLSQLGLTEQSNSLIFSERIEKVGTTGGELLGEIRGREL